jgi:hypothetical protein
VAGSKSANAATLASQIYFQRHRTRLNSWKDMSINF